MKEEKTREEIIIEDGREDSPDSKAQLDALSAFFRDNYTLFALVGVRKAVLTADNEEEYSSIQSGTFILRKSDINELPRAHKELTFFSTHVPQVHIRYFPFNRVGSELIILMEKYKGVFDTYNGIVLGESGDIHREPSGMVWIGVGDEAADEPSISDRFATFLAKKRRVAHESEITTCTVRQNFRIAAQKVKQDTNISIDPRLADFGGAVHEFLDVLGHAHAVMGRFSGRVREVSSVATGKACTRLIRGNVLEMGSEQFNTGEFETFFNTLEELCNDMRPLFSGEVKIEDFRFNTQGTTAVRWIKKNAELLKERGHHNLVFCTDAPTTMSEHTLTVNTAAHLDLKAQLDDFIRRSTVQKIASAIGSLIGMGQADYSLPEARRGFEKRREIAFALMEYFDFEFGPFNGVTPGKKNPQRFDFMGSDGSYSGITVHVHDDDQPATYKLFRYDSATKKAVIIRQGSVFDTLKMKRRRILV